MTVIPDIRNALDKEICQQSLYHFARRAWEIVEPGTTFVDGWHIRAIAAHLEAVTRGEISNLLITIPPRHMKSLLVSVFWPAWVWTHNPEYRWLFSSYALELSIRDSVRCRRIIESNWYQSLWGDVFKLTTDQNRKSRFENDKCGHRIATAVDGSNTGEGGDCIVVDDPHNVKEALSDTTRNAVIEWWKSTMSTRLNSPSTGRRVIVMQRCHQEDLGGYVLRTGYWEHLNLPCRYDPARKCRTSINFCDPREKEGELLWPERFSEETITRLEAELGEYDVAAQLQQSPIPKGGGCIKREWWRFYTELPELERMIISVDAAFKGRDTSDYVVMQVWGQSNANAYLITQIRDRMDFPRTCIQLEILANTYPEARAKLIEDKANGPAILDTLRNRIPGLIAVTPEGGKEARANAIAPYIQAGNVYLPSNAPWLEAFLEECSYFPHGRHDDQVDAMTQALLYLYRSGGDTRPEIIPPQEDQFAPMRRMDSPLLNSRMRITHRPRWY